MVQRTLVPDAGEVVLESVRAEGRDQFLLVLRSSGERWCCPHCQRASCRVHSHYLRRLSDLPWEGIPVRIQFQGAALFLRQPGVRSESLYRTPAEHAKALRSPNLPIECDHRANCSGTWGSWGSRWSAAGSAIGHTGQRLNIPS